MSAADAVRATSGSDPMSAADAVRAARLRTIVDDVLTGRDLLGLEPLVARDLQLAAAAVNHDRFHRLRKDLARLLDQR